MMCTRGLEAAISSTSAPVPSGEPSSTTRMLIRGSCARTLSIIRAMFCRSLNVGTMTRAFSDTTPPVHQEPGEQEDGGDPDGRAGELLPGLERLAHEAELDIPRTLRQWNADQRVVCASDLGCPPVHGRAPARVVVLGDDERRA